jgi:repressor LexA
MPRPPLQKLSDTHFRIAEAVAEFERNERPAYVPELVTALKLARPSSLTPTLRIMARNGFVDLPGKSPGGKRRAQIVRLTPKGRHALGIGGLPLLGSIPAGLIAEAVAGAEEVIDPGAVLPWKPGDFLLRVRGDSMSGDGILDGDLVLLRPQADLASGSIAAACVGDEREATLKRVFIEEDRVRLRAAHPAYPDVVVPGSSLWIAGVFKGLVRHAGPVS